MLIIKWHMLIAIILIILKLNTKLDVSWWIVGTVALLAVEIHWE